MPAPRGRPASATREEVLASALRRYLRCERVDVQAIAAELGVSRATVYRWFGSRDGLIAEVLVRAATPLLEDARRRSGPGGGARALLETFDAFNRSLAAAPPLLHFVESEREAAVRIITDGAGGVQPRIVEMITAIIEEEVARGAYAPPVEPATLGYAIVRLAEAFLFNDAAAGMRGDVDRLRDVEAALLGAGSRGRVL